jgi:xanthine dehydrogenase molybdopterin-binding subunit B
MLLARNDDMRQSGQRHPFLFKYRAGFGADGELLAVDVQCYNNGGHSNSVTKEVMDRALFHGFNAYTVRAYRARGWCCRTNLPDFTAFRGFGATQVMFMTETVMEQGAAACGLPIELVRARNLIPSGYTTPAGQLVPQSHLPQLWAAILADANVAERRRAVDRFNKANRWVRTCV